MQTVFARVLVVAALLTATFAIVLTLLTRAQAASSCTLSSELQDPQWIERQAVLTANTLKIAAAYVDLCETGQCDTIPSGSKSDFKKAVRDRVEMLHRIVACTGGKGS